VLNLHLAARHDGEKKWCGERDSAVETDHEELPPIAIGIGPVVDQSRVHRRQNGECGDPEQEESGYEANAQVTHLGVFVAQSANISLKNCFLTVLFFFILYSL